jgi:hypothetical protein
MSSPISCFHPIAYGESIGAGLCPASCFFLLFTGKYRERGRIAGAPLRKHRLHYMRGPGPKWREKHACKDDSAAR